MSAPRPSAHPKALFSSSASDAPVTRGNAVDGRVFAPTALQSVTGAWQVGAQYQYGLLWLSGRGVPKQDESEAAKWIKRAAEAGNFTFFFWYLPVISSAYF